MKDDGPQNNENENVFSNPIVQQEIADFFLYSFNLRKDNATPEYDAARVDYLQSPKATIMRNFVFQANDSYENFSTKFESKRYN